MITQKEYVEGCLKYYAENGIQPGDPEEGLWEEAHYPLPSSEGSDTILLLHDHHQVQGILQSEEVGRKCYWDGEVRKFLTYGPFVDCWFDLWIYYQKWSNIHSKQMGSLGGRGSFERGVGMFAPGNQLKGAMVTVKKKLGVHGLSKEDNIKNGRKGGELGGRKLAELKKGCHAPGVASSAAKKLHSILWFDPQHPELGFHHFSKLTRLQREHGYPSGRDHRQKAS